MSRLILDEHIDYLEFMAKCNKENPRFVEAVNEVVELIRGMESKLAHYEDLEEQGRLIELPCKVGSKIYAVDYGTNGKRKIVSSTLDTIPEILLFKEYMGNGFYLTKEEAEKALAELKGE